LDKDRSKETQPSIGNVSEQTPKQDASKTSPEMYMYVITETCAGSAATLYNRLLWSDTLQYFGGRLALESLIVPGDWPEILHTVKILGQNSGAVRIY